jgi:ribA/ribD-fused uncharacterized protein
MKYTTENILPLTDRKFLFFWGHTPKQAGVPDQACLSQWWEAAFTVEGITYPSAEHWMMAGKARLFGDEETLAQILVTPKPGQAKGLGRTVKDFDHEEWMKHAYDIVLQGSLHKFGQNEALKAFLLNTGNKILVEASPVDFVWGIGMAHDHRDAMNPAAWRGPNLLGFALMEARDILSNR